MDRNSHDKSTDVLDDVHKVEEEIDRFLRAKSEQAEKILITAREEAEAIRSKGGVDALSEAERERDRLLAQAEEKAAAIERQGSAAARAEAERLDGLREKVITHILQLVRAEAK